MWAYDGKFKICMFGWRNKLYKNGVVHYLNGRDKN